MTADSGGSGHFVYNQLLHVIERKMINYVDLDINIAGHHGMSGVGKGVLVG